MPLPSSHTTVRTDPYTAVHLTRWSLSTVSSTDTILYMALGALYCLLSTASRPEAEACLRERRFKHRAQALVQSLLDEPIQHRRDPQEPFPAAWLGDAHLANRMGLVRPFQQFGLDRRPVLPHEVAQLRYPEAIDPGSTLVA